MDASPRISPLRQRMLDDMRMRSKRHAEAVLLTAD